MEREKPRKEARLRWVMNTDQGFCHSFIHSSNISHTSDRQRKRIQSINRGWYFVMGVTTHKETSQGRSDSEASERHVSLSISYQSGRGARVSSFLKAWVQPANLASKANRVPWKGSQNKREAGEVGREPALAEHLQGLLCRA